MKRYGRLYVRFTVFNFKYLERSATVWALKLKIAAC